MNTILPANDTALSRTDTAPLLYTRTEEQERQLARFEGTIAAITEIKLDLKELLKRQ